ncbi:DUF6325 family protein [Streptomyces sp. NPDC046909]|uniref:DUF6325 family protein n=1 Tax=Streptomyces sp. NPDC046909 TaxID=3155617 RepID=UPI0033D4F566
MGPVEFVVLAFPEEGLTADVVKTLAELRLSGEVRLIDSLVVTKAATGEVATAELAEIEEFADVVAGHDEASLIGPEDAAEVAAVLDPGHAALVLLVEHVWAARAADAVRAAGGRVAASVRIPPGHVTQAHAARREALATAPQRS